MAYEEVPGPARHGLTGRPAWVAALGLAVLQVLGTGVAARHQAHRVDLDGLGYVLLLAGPALLAARRRWPVAVTAAVASVTFVYTLLGYPYGPVFASLVVAFFSAVAAGHRRAVLTVAALVYAGHVLVGLWLYRWLPPGGDHPVSWAEVSGVAAWMLAVLAGAELFRMRREQLARDRRERAAAARRRADEERLRIARELHDVLAHSISLINVQAGVALELIDERPEQARTALTTIKAASKEALGEVRQVLGTLRAPGEAPRTSAPRAPSPGLDRLPELVEQAGAAGLEARVAIEGRRGAVPAGVDLAAFRIVQEALTNVVRHSGARTARVRVGYLPGRIEVVVEDDGPATAGGDSGGGNGLVGMRERAAALDGTVAAGRLPGGGFRVHAVLPLRGRAGGTGDDAGPSTDRGEGEASATGEARPPSRPPSGARPAARFSGGSAGARRVDGAAFEEHR